VAEFRVLGPLEVFVDGERLPLPVGKPRALLAVLLLHPNRPVAMEKLIDELWGDDPPARATKSLQVYISQLRKPLGADRLLTRPPGYELVIADDELDLERFERLAAAGRERLASGDPLGASARLGEALALWRGPALREFRNEPFAHAASARLEDLHIGAVEDRIEAELAAGGTDRSLVPELEELVEAEPLRERPRELLMLALYRSGRQADALELYRRTRELYMDELGIEPGPELRRLEQAVLRHDADLQLPRGATVAAAPATARRRWRVPALLLVAAVAGIAVAAAVVEDGGRSSSQATTRANPELRPFVQKLENFLEQSRTGRNDVRQTVAAAVDCRLSPAEAEARLDSVERNRQSILQQLAALRIPAGDAPLRSSDLLQKAIAASIAADSAYRDWLRLRTGCRSGAAAPVAARRADANATALKRRFVVAFDPLARRFGQRVWKAAEF
jgi:DNA-binding SARP family transcriptional activator